MNKSVLFTSLLSMGVSMVLAIVCALLMPYYSHELVGWVLIVLNICSIIVSYRAAIRELGRYK